MNPNYTYPSWDPMVKFQQEMKLRNFSQKTIKSYLQYTRECLRFATVGAHEVTAKIVRDYLEFLVDNGKSASTLNIAYSALQLYFEKILHRKFFSGIPRAKNTKTLPTVLSKQEVSRILEVIENKKHHFIVSLFYGTGLRLQELQHIQMCDIDLDRKLLKVTQGKGKKDRMVMLPNKLTEVLNIQMKLKTPQEYLFTSNRNKMMDV
jgi:site-specific recombinase XerD